MSAPPALLGDVLYLLHMDGAEGGVVFTDSGDHANTVTVVGGSRTTLLNGASGFDAAWSSSGASGSLVQLTNANLALLQTDDFTYSLRIRPLTIQNGFEFISGDPGNSFFWLFNLGRVGFRHAGTTFDCGPVPTTGEWHQYTATRESGVLRVFADGALQFTSADVNAWSATTHYFGTYPTNAPFDGLLDEILFMKGQALWTAAFTVPTLPFGSPIPPVPEPGAGYMLDMKQSGFGLVPLSYHASAVHADPVTDNLYLVLDFAEEPTVTYSPVYSTIPTVDGLTIYQFDSPDTAELLTYRWRGKLNILTRPAAPQFCQVQAEDFNDITLRLYGNGALIYEVLVLSSEEFTLPTDNEFNTYEIEVVGTSRVRSIKVAETIDEID